jgi:microcystin-dependent protein
MVKILSDVTLSAPTDDLAVGGNIELGHATDTTLSRSAAGVLAVEGVTVALTNQIPPTGSIVMWATATAPTNWLFLDGSTYSQATYPDLAAVFGVTTGTFTLPDMRDRFAAGAATVAALSNNAGTFAPNTANATAHDHTTNIAHGHADTIAVSTHADHTHNVDPASTASGAPSATFNLAYSGGATNVSIPTTTHTHSTNIASTASSAEVSNLTHTVTGSVTSLGATSVTSSSGGGTLTPKSTLLNFIIKT